MCPATTTANTILFPPLCHVPTTTGSSITHNHYHWKWLPIHMVSPLNCHLKLLTAALLTMMTLPLPCSPTPVNQSTLLYHFFDYKGLGLQHEWEGDCLDLQTLQPTIFRQQCIKSHPSCAEGEGVKHQVLYGQHPSNLSSTI